MLARAEKGDLPELGATEREIREARDFVVSEATPVGPLLRTLQLQLKPVKREPRGTVGVEVASPMAMLYVACQCKWFGELVQRTYDRDPCSSMAPWQLVFYADEARPGSKFKSDNKRVVQNIYFTVLNFGAAALAKEDYWLVAGCVKSGLVRQLEGGMSQVMGALLALAFSASGVHLALAGLSVDLPGGRSLRIYARVECLLGDESSLHQIWLCKGASGIKCCLECQNVVSPSWIAKHAIEDNHIAQPWDRLLSTSALRLHTIDSILAIVDSLAATQGALTKDEFEKRETRLGWTHSSHSILLHPASRPLVNPAAQNCFDWVHNILQGVFNITLWLCLKDVQASNVQFSALHDYMQHWTWPRRLGKGASGVDLFSRIRTASHKDAKIIKCSASEALSVHLPIAHWMRTVFLREGRHVASCNVFLRLSTLISMLWYGARLQISACEVAEATNKFLDAFANTFGVKHMIWKFHAILHHARYVERYGWSPHTITMERKHKHILHLAEPLHNTKASDNLLREVVAKHLGVLTNASNEFLDMRIGLYGGKPPSKKLGEFFREQFGECVQHLVAARARFCEWESCSSGDVVAVRDPDHARDWYVAAIWFHVDSAGVKWSAVSTYTCVAKEPSFSRWKKLADPGVVYLTEILEVLIHSKSGDEVTVLRPLSLFGR